jgi:hypothetical protein
MSAHGEALLDTHGRPLEPVRVSPMAADAYARQS